MTCSPASVVMILVAGMMPEELKDDAAAEHVRRTQLHLLQLAEQFPQAMFYSNYFRWGMLHEVSSHTDVAWYVASFTTLSVLPVDS